MIQNLFFSPKQDGELRKVAYGTATSSGYNMSIPLDFVAEAFVIYATSANGTYTRVWLYDGTKLYIHGNSSRGATFSSGELSSQFNVTNTGITNATNLSQSGTYKYIAVGR